MGNTTSEQASSAKAAIALDRLLANEVEQLAKQIGSLDQEIARIGRLAPISEQTERAKALAASEAELSATARHLDRIVQSAGYGGLGAPVASFKAWLSVRRARHRHAEGERELDEPQVQARRATLISNHNRHVDDERARLGSLRTELARSTERHTDIVQFRKDSADALVAAGSDGWTAADFHVGFLAMAREAQAGDVQSARKHLAVLRFQRKPSDAKYAGWEKEALTIRDSAYATYAGMPASGAYTEIAAQSIELSHRVLHARQTDILSSYTHAADRWQVLSGILTHPLHLKVDALWAVYWAMFQAGQSVERALSQSMAHEDVLTGKLSAQIDRWLSDWAARRVAGFGYPNVASYMGILEIASKGEEARLGADIGLIVDLELGDHRCRKVVLLQAKKAKRGVADIGSTSGQLRKLAAVPDMGFYLFYHQSDGLVRAPAPTICSAQDLAAAVESHGRPLDAPYLRVDVRTAGWDWASFVSFGLCQPDSGLGEGFTTPYDALEKLGGGNSGQLPTYLHVIAIADEPRVLDLRQQIRAHYRDLTPSPEHTQRHGRNQGRERDGPELGL